MPPAAASLSSQTDDILAQQRRGASLSSSPSSTRYYEVTRRSPQSVMQYDDNRDHEGMYCMEILPSHSQHTRVVDSVPTLLVQRRSAEPSIRITNQRLLQRFRSFVRRRRRSRKVIPKAASQPPTAAASTPSPTTTTGNVHYVVQKLANIAFLLCIIDCTVLPLIAFLLPIISSSPSSGGVGDGIINNRNNNNNTNDNSSGGGWFYYHLHQVIDVTLVHNVQFMKEMMIHPNLGHWLAIWFVLPIGSISAILNYYLSHHQLWLLSIATFGLVCVSLANAEHHQHHQFIVNHHHVINIVGCICLLGTNYITRRYYCCCINHNLHHQQQQPTSRVMSPDKKKMMVNTNSPRLSGVTYDNDDGFMLCTATTIIPNGSPLTKRHAACYCHRV